MKISRDVNGNKTLKITNQDLNGDRGFSIQTLGNLPVTHQNGICGMTIIEVKLYIANHGTKSQREKIDTLITRNEYMNASGSHHDYYAQFVTESTMSFVRDVVGIDKILKSTCPHLNDVAKQSNGGSGSWVWDRSPFNLTLARRAGEVSERGIGSQSTHTCIGKAAAKILIAQHNGNK